MSLTADLDSSSMSVLLDVRHPLAYLALHPAIELGRSRDLRINWLPLAMPALHAPTVAEPGETREQTALREVSEETGLEVVIREYIGDIDYWFVLPGGARCHKTVYFYLMTATGGDMSRHDSEFDYVRWFPAPEALRTMTHQNEVRVVEKGLSMAAG